MSCSGERKLRGQDDQTRAMRMASPDREPRREGEPRGGRQARAACIRGNQHPRHGHRHPSGPSKTPARERCSQNGRAPRQNAAEAQFPTATATKDKPPAQRTSQSERWNGECSFSSSATETWLLSRVRPPSKGLAPIAAENNPTNPDCQVRFRLAHMRYRPR